MSIGVIRDDRCFGFFWRDIYVFSYWFYEVFFFVKFVCFNGGGWINEENDVDVEVSWFWFWKKIMYNERKKRLFEKISILLKSKFCRVFMILVWYLLWGEFIERIERLEIDIGFFMLKVW